MILDRLPLPQRLTRVDQLVHMIIGEIHLSLANEHTANITSTIESGLYQIEHSPSYSPYVVHEVVVWVHLQDCL